jgi:aspartate-semialdehyde dehydrogenase
LIALAVVLKPIDDAAELKRVVVVVRTGISSRSARNRRARAAARDLLSGVSPDTKAFPQRLAFNLIPQVGDFVSGGRAASGCSNRNCAVCSSFPICPSRRRASICRCSSGRRVRCTSRPNVRWRPSWRARCARRRVCCWPGDDDYPTLGDIIGSEATHVGRVRDDPTVPFGLAVVGDRRAAQRCGRQRRADRGASLERAR